MGFDMKTIYFIRHAKAEKGEAIIDKDRKLSNKGKEACKELCKFLKKEKFNPSIIFSSTAIRALKTAEIIKSELKLKAKIQTDEKLYTFNEENLTNFIVGLKDGKKNKIAIVGHNDAITRICEKLSDCIIGSIPTCGIFALNLDINNFCEISDSQGEIEFYYYPKRIKSR